jgi:hypothetical protein
MKKEFSQTGDGAEVVEFIPKTCPKCKELMSIRKLGVWGYYCIDCMFWWGTYDPWPKVKQQKSKNI